MTDSLLPDLSHGVGPTPAYDKESAIALSIGSSPSIPLYKNSENVVEANNVYLDRAGFLFKGPEILPWKQTNGTCTLTAQELFGGIIFLPGAGPFNVTLPTIQEVLKVVDFSKIPVSDTYTAGQVRDNAKVFATFQLKGTAGGVYNLVAPAASTVAGHAGTSGYRRIVYTTGAVNNLAAAASTTVDLATICVFFEKGADEVVWGYLLD